MKRGGFMLHSLGGFMLHSLGGFMLHSLGGTGNQLTMTQHSEVARAELVPDYIVLAAWGTSC